MKQRIRVPSNAHEEKRPPAAASLDETVEAATAGPSQPLDSSARSFLEPRFGHDFSSVRIHADSRAAQSADAIQADAYATGNDIVFAQGRYQPGSADGKKLLAHELAHVVQQSAASPMVQRVAPPSTSLRYNEPNTLPPTVQLPDTGPAPPGKYDNSDVAEWGSGTGILSTKTRYSRDFDTQGQANVFAASLGQAAAVFLEEDRFVVYPLHYSAWGHFTYDNVKFDDESGDCAVSSALPVWSIVTEDGVTILPGHMKLASENKEYFRAQEYPSGKDPFADRKDVFGQGLGGITDKDTFLDEFRSAMRQVALSALDKSQKEAEAKQKEMEGGALPANVDKAMLMDMARQLVEIDKHIGNWRMAGAFERGVSHEERERETEKKKAALAELNARRNRVLLDYPLLGQVDPQDFLEAESEQEQAAMLGGAAGDVVKNAQKTRDSVLSGDIDLWTVKSVVDTTKSGLGIQDDGRKKWIEEKVRKSGEANTTDSVLNAFQIAFSIAALALSGGAAAPFVVGALGISTVQAVRITEEYTTKEAAANTDIDKEKTLLPPDLAGHWGSVALAWIAVGMSAADAVYWAKAAQAGEVTADEAVSAVAQSSQLDESALRAALGTAERKGSGDLVELMAKAGTSPEAGAEYAKAMAREFAGVNGNAGVLVQMSGGSWKNIAKKLNATGAPEANTLLDQMNAWRIQQYEDVETALSIQLEPTGTPSPISDMDASIMGPESNALVDKADKMLTERIGGDWKTRMDADLFSDPSRMWLLEKVDYKAAEAAIKQAEGRLVGEAELNVLAKMEMDAADDELIKQYAQDMGVSLEAVSERAEQLQLIASNSKPMEAEIDRLHAQFAAETDPSKQAALAEEIAEKQGLLNASKQGPYMTPGGVLKHVGRREVTFGLRRTPYTPMSPAMGYMAVLDDLYMCEHTMEGMLDVGINANNAKDLAKYADRLLNTAGSYGVDLYKAGKARDLLDDVYTLLAGARRDPAGLANNAAYEVALAGENLRAQLAEVRAAVRTNADAYLAEDAPAATSAAGGRASGVDASGGVSPSSADAADKQAAAEVVTKTEEAIKKQEELLSAKPQVSVEPVANAGTEQTAASAQLGKKLSSSGFAGSGDSADVGVFEGTIPGISEPVAIKVYRDGAKWRKLMAQEMENAQAASATGLAAKFYGEVPVGTGKIGFAMEKVKGELPDLAAGATSAEAIAQSELAKSHVTLATVQDVMDFGERLLAEGRYASGEIQGLVTEEGHWRAIDFQGYGRLPDKTAEPDAYAKALARHKNNVESEAENMKEIAKDNAKKGVGAASP